MKRIRLLIIDDDEDLLEVISAQLLNEYPFEITTSVSGEEALQLIERSAASYDLILSDVNMGSAGKMSGIDLIRKIRDNDLSIPVCLLSGATIEESVVADDPRYKHCYFISKPYRIKELVSALFNCFGK